MQDLHPFRVLLVPKPIHETFAVRQRGLDRVVANGESFGQIGRVAGAKPAD